MAPCQTGSTAGLCSTSHVHEAAFISPAAGRSSNKHNPSPLILALSSLYCSRSYLEVSDFSLLTDQNNGLERLRTALPSSPHCAAARLTPPALSVVLGENKSFKARALPPRSAPLRRGRGRGWATDGGEGTMCT
ncbi:unnamed protein product [Boreogadus saida]